MTSPIKLKTSHSMNEITIFTILGLLLIPLGIITVMYGLWESSQKYNWTQELVNEQLGVAIPFDASNLEFTRSRQWSDHLRVSFQGNADVIDSFASHFCGGVYFSGFDPFRAQDTSERLGGSHPITLYSYSYYAYSIGTPLSIWGNRCEASPADAAYIELSIDKANPSQYQITMELYFSCNACRNIT